MKTEQKVIDQIKKYNSESKAGRMMFEEVKKALKPFIGKPYSKKMDTALKNHFGPDFDVGIERLASLINLKIKGPWKDQGEYWEKNGYSMLIGYSTTETYEEGSSEVHGSGINYFSCSYGDASIKREKQNQKILKSEKKIRDLARAIDMAEESKKILKLSAFNSYNFPALYNIERTFKLAGRE